MKRQFRFSEGNTFKACFTSLELEALLVLIYQGYAPDRLEPETQAMIEKKLKTVTMNAIGSPDWKEHVKHLIEVNESDKLVRL